VVVHQHHERPHYRHLQTNETRAGEFRARYILYLDDDHKVCNKKFAVMLGYKSPKEWAATEAPLSDVIEADQILSSKAYVEASEKMTAGAVEVDLKTSRRRKSSSPDDHSADRIRRTCLHRRTILVKSEQLFSKKQGFKMLFRWMLSGQFTTHSAKIWRLGCSSVYGNTYGQQPGYSRTPHKFYNEILAWHATVKKNRYSGRRKVAPLVAEAYEGTTAVWTANITRWTSCNDKRQVGHRARTAIYNFHLQFHLNKEKSAPVPDL